MESQIRDLIVPLTDRLIKQLTAVHQQTAHQPPDLFTLEVLVSKLLALFALGLLAGLIKLWHGRGLTPQAVSCQSCGARLSVQRYIPRTILCCFGSFDDERAYYYCRVCHRSRLPLDEVLGVGARQISPGRQRVVAFLAAHLSFGVVEKAVGECFGVEVNKESIRQVAEEVGAEARAWEERERAAYEQAEVELRPIRAVKTWIIEADGKQVGMQDGSWQEVKVGLIYELGARVEPYTGRHELLKREIVARRCGWEEFAGQFWTATGARRST